MGGMLPCKKQKLTPVIVESDAERPDSDKDDVTSINEAEEGRKDSVQREESHQEVEGHYWLMAENG